ncbi:MAG: class I SAM-dependent methyltransferase [Nitrospirota bacterium]|nr:class I SAM-dependent methyltransferase [Nitrospirota bacterium]
MTELAEKRNWIKSFFSETGSTYDEVVNRFTFGIDRLWKKKILSKIPPCERVLDLACGTGILTFAIKNKYPECEITGVDISEGYLSVAREKALQSATKNLSFMHCPAEDYISDRCFDVVTTSYLPKYADIPRLMHNVGNMLAPNGRVIFHDFTYPTSKFLQLIFEVYFKCAQPIGAFYYPEWKDVLSELPKVIQKSQWISELSTAMNNEGFKNITVETLTLQGAAIVSGEKE